MDDVKNELFVNGPLTGGIQVYPDFMNYKSGIYSPALNQTSMGGHAIKVIGYGVENGTAYWLCANSWNTTWGIKGYFKVKQGASGINDLIIGCQAAV